MARLRRRSISARITASSITIPQFPEPETGANSISVHLGKIPHLNHDGGESDADRDESETLNDPEADIGTEEVAPEEES